MRRTLAAALLAATCVPAPALADDPGGVGVAVEGEGLVYATTLDHEPGYDAHGLCAFTGVLLPNFNTYDIGYGGAAWATGAPRVAAATILECSVSNVLGQVANFVWANGGPATAHAASVTGWVRRPDTVCVRARSFYPPPDPFDVDTGRQCQGVPPPASYS